LVPLRRDCQRPWQRAVAYRGIDLAKAWIMRTSPAPIEMDKPAEQTQIKLRDVARRAGVSPATVSRALTTPDKVSADALRRVREAVQVSGYVPHGAARALRSRRTRTVGVVIPTL